MSRAGSTGLTPQPRAETGPAQFEIVISHEPALQAADSIMLAKEAIKLIAHRHALVASFHPKPLAAGVCSGCHLHFSVEQASASSHTLKPGPQQCVLVTTCAGPDVRLQNGCNLMPDFMLQPAARKQAPLPAEAFLGGVLERLGQARSTWCLSPPVAFEGMRRADVRLQDGRNLMSDFRLQPEARELAPLPAEAFLGGVLEHLQDLLLLALSSPASALRTGRENRSGCSHRCAGHAGRRQQMQARAAPGNPQLPAQHVWTEAAAECTGCAYGQTPCRAELRMQLQTLVIHSASASPLPGDSRGTSARQGTAQPELC